MPNYAPAESPEGAFDTGQSIGIQNPNGTETVNSIDFERNLYAYKSFYSGFRFAAKKRAS